MAALGADAEATLSRGVAEVLGDQEQVGIDIPTDGEVPRENYIHYHCRHLEGGRLFQPDGENAAQWGLRRPIAHDSTARPRQESVFEA